MIPVCAVSISRRVFEPALSCALLLGLSGCQPGSSDSEPGVSAGVESITPEEARVIAKEAYIYANPVVDSYRVMYGYFLDPEHPEFKAPLNQINNIPRV